MAADLKPAELRAWAAFLDAQAALLRQLESELVEKEDMTLAEFDVLIQLGVAPDRRLRMTELSERVRLSRSGLTRLVDRLVQEGLVKRARCASDRRGTFATLTAAGGARPRRGRAGAPRGPYRPAPTDRRREPSISRRSGKLETASAAPRRPFPLEAGDHRRGRFQGRGGPSSIARQDPVHPVLPIWPRSRRPGWQCGFCAGRGLYRPGRAGHLRQPS